MKIPKVFESEYRLCLLIWDHEPVSSTELVRLCAEAFEWKKSTTYTMIKKLAEKGIVKSENAIVTSLVSKHEIQRAESQEFINKTFEGSLPNFIAAFASSKKLSNEDVAQIQKMIDQYKEGEL